jgi:hypothetical protein
MTVQSPLNTVQSLIDDVRTLLLDKVQPYRYGDDELMVALNTALLEARRTRADLFVTRWGGNSVPYYAAPTGEQFCIEPQFRLGFVYGTAAHALLRDDEDVQDARAASFLGRFYHILGVPQPGPVRGGTPNAAQKKDA